MLQITIPSPFVIGRPLRADEALFGRDQVIADLQNYLNQYSSVNLIGERRIGKSSLLNHLLGNPLYQLPPAQPSLLLVRIDLQANVTRAEQFYGHALRAFLTKQPQLAIGDQLQRLTQQPETDFNEFDASLRCWQGQYRPVLVIDEFERLLEPQFRIGFPFPTFFEGLRALITANVLAFVIASRLSLREHFECHPSALTSSFPNYFTPIRLGELNEHAADTLLLQQSLLNLAQVQQAKRWASRHPCRLQCAGQAWYEANRDHQDSAWAKQHYQDLQQQACTANQAHLPLSVHLRRVGRKLGRIMLAIVHFPPHLFVCLNTAGGVISMIGQIFVGFVVFALLAGILIGKIQPKELLDFLKAAIAP